MNRAVEERLTALTIAYDEICLQIKALEAEKAALRGNLISAFDAAISEEYAYLDKPADSSYHFQNPVNGLIYRKSVAEVGASFDAEVFTQDYPDIPVVKKTMSYRLDEEAAQQWLKDHPDQRAVFQSYATQGKPQVRIYQGIAPTDDDL